MIKVRRTKRSKTLCVNFAVMPLYHPMKYMCLGLGQRLGSYISGKDTWWDYADENIAQISFHNIRDAIQQYLLSWFENLSKEDNYKKRLESDIVKQTSYPCKEWISAINSKDKVKRILENSENLKLPKKLVHSYLQQKIYEL